jgi:hypothetical protein
MQGGVIRQNITKEIGIHPDEVRIGKDIIELVTSGMYVFPVTIYREYIQNAVDAIDIARVRGLIGSTERGKVSIRIEPADRCVVIHDNGCGIPACDAASTLVAIGGSPKRGTGARGFRGVGRLSGLAYCQELEFRTKVAGDPSVVSVVWDCKTLRGRLADSTFRGDVRKLISQCTAVFFEKASNSADHFFEVRMRNVARHRQDMLLNEKLIGHYLAQVAPLPFANDFSYGAAIEAKLAEFVTRVSVELTVNEETIKRPYSDETRLPGGPYYIKINEIEFLQFADIDGRIGAVGWLGHHDYVRSIHPSVGIRGLRGRIGDIQVGEPNLFDDCFKEPRFNGWSIGEIHVLDPRIVPNGRRDNFELNHHAYNLITQIGPVAAQVAKRCRLASISRNSALIVTNTINEIEGRLAQPRPLARAEVSKFRAAIQRGWLKLTGVSEPRWATLGPQLSRLEERLEACSPTEEGSVVALEEALALVVKHVSNRELARKLIEALRRICG